MTVRRRRKLRAEPLSWAEIASDRPQPAATSAPMRQRAQAALAHAPLQEAMGRASRLLDAARAIAGADSELAALRTAGREIRARSAGRIETNAARLEKQLLSLGADVHRARDAADARRIVIEIAEAHDVRLAVKSKSMATEEIHLNKALEGAGIDVVESDLGEYIVQLAHERPSHILAPAVHKSAHDVAALFSEQAGRELESLREELAGFARNRLRETFLAAGLGITGVNFAVASTGTLAMVSNEGNLRMATTLPPLHIALLPMDKVIATMDELAIMLPLLTRSATGQRMSAYVSLLTGPAREGELDGAREMHVILLDNGRTDAAKGPYADMLRCIRCGACMNVCPVYRKVGGHAYNGAYPGPMGSVLGCLLGEADGQEAAFASTLCGACSEACPVGIPLHEMLASLRAAPAQPLGAASSQQDRARPDSRRRLDARGAFRAWSLLWSSRSGYAVSTWLARLGSQLLRRLGIAERQRAVMGSEWAGPGLGRPGPLGRRLSAIAAGRCLPLPAGESFRQWWGRTHGLRRSPVPVRQDAQPAPGLQPIQEAEAPRPAVAAAGEIIPEFSRRLTASGGEPHGPLTDDELAGKLLAIIGESLTDQPAGSPPFVVVDESPELEFVRPLLAGAGIEVRQPPRGDSERAAAGITSALAAAADTGSVLLATGPERPRQTSLLPPVHIAIVPPGALVPSFAGAMARLSSDHLPSAAIFVTGPSKSADIEMVMTTGVHGPRRMIALVRA